MGVIINTDRIEELRIWEYLENSSMGYSLEDVAQTNVTLIGMQQENWSIVKGRRTTRDYLNDDDEVVVRFVCDYGEDSNGNIVTLDRKIEYITIDDEVGLEKTILKTLSDTYMITLNREIRQNQIDNLRGRGAALRATGEALGEPYLTQYSTVADNVDFLWTHYKNQIEDYVQTGSTAFKSAVEDETDANITAILDIVASQEGFTVSDTILEEIN